MSILGNQPKAVNRHDKRSFTYYVINFLAFLPPPPSVINRNQDPPPLTAILRNQGLTPGINCRSRKLNTELQTLHTVNP